MPSRSPLPPLPADIDVAAFDALQEDVERWRDVIEAIAARHSPAPVTPTAAGSVLVGLVGRDLVVKLYPPFLRDHFEFEAATLPRLHGRLSVPTPALRLRAEHDGWPYLVMSQLHGHKLDAVWPALDEAEKCRVLRSIGRLAAEVHALPPDGLAALAPDWPAFLQRQRAGCQRRQARTGLPPHLLAQLDGFMDGALPAGPAVILTGEYTPMNLLHDERGLCAMFDFGDGLVGPREYDWLGPLCFLAAGHAARCDAYFEGYSSASSHDLGGWRTQRLPLLRLLLLHRYSNLPAQIARPGWQAARSFEELAVLAWP